MSNRVAPIMGGVVAVALIVGVTVLGALGRPASELLALISTGIIPVLSLALYGKLTGISGTSTELVDLVRTLQADVIRLRSEVAGLRSAFARLKSVVTRLVEGDAGITELQAEANRTSFPP